MPLHSPALHRDLEVLRLPRKSEAVLGAWNCSLILQDGTAGVGTTGQVGSCCLVGWTLRKFGALGFSLMWILKSSFWRWEVEGAGHEQKGPDEARQRFPKCCCWWTDCARTRVTWSVCPSAGSWSHTFRIRISRREPRNPQFNRLAVGAYVVELEEFIP